MFSKITIVSHFCDLYFLSVKQFFEDFCLQRGKTSIYFYLFIYFFDTTNKTINRSQTSGRKKSYKMYEKNRFHCIQQQLEMYELKRRRHYILYKKQVIKLNRIKIMKIYNRHSSTLFCLSHLGCCLSLLGFYCILMSH